MNSSQLLGITTFAYLLSAILYIAIFVFRAKKLGLLATLTTAGAFLINTAGIGLRWQESYQAGIGYAPGMPPRTFEPETAMFVPAGSKIVFQMHYTPNGTI